MVEGSRGHPLGIPAANTGSRRGVPVSQTSGKKTVNFHVGKTGEKVAAVLVAPNAPMPDMEVPVAKGGAYRGSAMTIQRSQSGTDRRVRIAGHQFLGEVGFPYTVTQPGQRSTSGIRSISPDALGGPLLLQSETYEQHRARKLQIKYVPNCSSLAKGSIAMYFRNDVATPVDVVGIEELAHAATHPAFVQTQIWQPAALPIRPDDATIRYFDTDSGDARLQVQGMVTIESAVEQVSSDLSSGSCGNLFLEYDIEFFDEELDYEVADVTSGRFVASADAFSAQQMDPIEITAQLSIISPGQFNLTFLDDLPRDVKAVFAGVIIDDGTAESEDILSYTTVGSAAIKQAANGTGVFVRFFQHDPASADFTDGSIYARLYSDLASAQADTADSSVDIAQAQPGTWLWAASGSATCRLSVSYVAAELTYD